MNRLSVFAGLPVLALIVAGCSAPADPPEATTSASPDTAPVAPHQTALTAALASLPSERACSAWATIWVVESISR